MILSSLRAVFIWTSLSQILISSTSDGPSAAHTPLNLRINFRDPFAFPLTAGGLIVAKCHFHKELAALALT